MYESVTPPDAFHASLPADQKRAASAWNAPPSHTPSLLQLDEDVEHGGQALSDVTGRARCNVALYPRRKLDMKYGEPNKILTKKTISLSTICIGIWLIE